MPKIEINPSPPERVDVFLAHPDLAALEPPLVFPQRPPYSLTHISVTHMLLGKREPRLKYSGLVLSTTFLEYYEYDEQLLGLAPGTQSCVAVPLWEVKGVTVTHPDVSPAVTHASSRSLVIATPNADIEVNADYVARPDAVRRVILAAVRLYHENRLTAPLRNAPTTPQLAPPPPPPPPDASRALAELEGLAARRLVGSEELPALQVVALVNGATLSRLLEAARMLDQGRVTPEVFRAVKSSIIKQAGV